MFHSYLDAGRLPWPNLPQSVTRVLERWQRPCQTAFEIALEHTARQDRQLKLMPRLLRRKENKRGFTIPGEIDLLVADASTHLGDRSQGLSGRLRP